ncbi:hypothetical protein O9992_30750 [Vibrio lentus]|nr:hypothetical protein [Vibrio lentus]
MATQPGVSQHIKSLSKLVTVTCYRENRVSNRPNKVDYGHSALLRKTKKTIESLSFDNPYSK